MSSSVHESSGAYAVHALDAAELAEYEAHLATCPTCPDEVRNFSEAAAELALLVEATPPAGMRERVLDSVLRLPQLPADDDDTVIRPLQPTARRPTERTPGRATGPRRAVPGSELIDESEPAQVDELARRRQRRRARFLSGLVAAMLALAVGLGGVVYSLVQERQTQVASQRLEEELLRAPDARVVVIDAKNGGRASFVVSRSQNRALFLGTDMPDPGDDKRYQMWTVTGNLKSGDIDPDLDNPVTNGGGQLRQFFRGDVANADALAISIEADGSTPEEPSASPVVLAPLST